MYGYSVVMMLPSRFLPPHVGGRGTRLLLVHGYLCNAGIWAWFARELTTRGYRVDVVTLEPLFGAIEIQAGRLAERSNRSGWRRVSASRLSRTAWGDW